MSHCWSPFFSWLLGGKSVFFTSFSSLDLGCSPGTGFDHCLFPPAPLLPDNWVPGAAGTGSCGAKWKGTAGRFLVSIAALYVKRFLSNPSLNILIQTDFTPEEEIMDVMYLILSQQNSTERSLSNPVPAVPALSKELDPKTSARSLPALIFLWASISPIWVSPSRTSKLAQTLCWALVANSSRILWRWLQNCIRKW